MKSQNAQVLKHLKSGLSLTSLQAFRMFGIMRLAARINDLKNKGHDIESKPVEHSGKRVALYSLAS